MESEQSAKRGAAMTPCELCDNPSIRFIEYWLLSPDCDIKRLARFFELDESMIRHHQVTCMTRLGGPE